MNRVDLVGRITKDPEIKFAGANQTAMVKFTLAVPRNDKDHGVDYPGITAFGKTAELMGTYVKKGKLLGVTGRIQTGSYEKSGQRYYSTDIIAEKVEFLDRKDEEDYVMPNAPAEKPQQIEGFTPFTHADDISVPF